MISSVLVIYGIHILDWLTFLIKKNYTIQNSKSEARNSEQILNLNDQMIKTMILSIQNFD